MNSLKYIHVCVSTARTECYNLGSLLKEIWQYLEWVGSCIKQLYIWNATCSVCLKHNKYVLFEGM